jgi:hydrogenase 3 maturation protease
MEVVNEFLNLLKDDKKIAFLGVGSPLRADDSIGLYIVSELEKRLSKQTHREYYFHLGESAPENFVGIIRSQLPSHVVIFDAAEMGQNPGTFNLIPAEQIDGFGFSTHMLPLKILIDYLKTTIHCQVIVVGIQPKLLEFGYPATDEVKNSADRFIVEICDKF